MIDDTGNLDRGTKAAPENGELGWSPLPTAPSAFHLHAHGPAHLRHRPIADHDERRILVAREADEAKRHLPRECRRTIEHHQREGATAQQHVGTPRPARRIARSHYPEEVAVERSPAGGIEGARCIDAGDPLATAQGSTYQRANQRRRAGTQRTDQFGEPTAGKPTPQRLVEFPEPGWEGIGHNRGRCDNLLELGAKLC
jgi:hypothetical protein